jgi:hypothetical protein
MRHQNLWEDGESLPRPSAEGIMRPVWLIEAGVYGAEADPLLAEIRRQGMHAEIVPFKALRQGQRLTVGSQPLPDGACVIGYGTFPFARQIQLHHRWVPGAWANPENLDCATYFGYFGKFLLNQRYALLPGLEAIQEQSWLFEVFGSDDTVFARPAGCHKLFTGRLMSKETFATGLAPTRYDPATLVVVAAPKMIQREWRVVIVEDRVIAGSQYAEEGTKAIKPGCPKPVQRYVEMMLREVRWRPDPVFMMDVCESERQFWLVELNGFSCSWLYRCDLAGVVSQVSAFAAATCEK